VIDERGREIDCHGVTSPMGHTPSARDRPTGTRVIDLPDWSRGSEFDEEVGTKEERAPLMPAPFRSEPSSGGSVRLSQ
jgi:hypothetical protein